MSGELLGNGRDSEGSVPVCGAESVTEMVSRIAAGVLHQINLDANYQGLTEDRWLWSN